MAPVKSARARMRAQARKKKKAANAAASAAGPSAAGASAAAPAASDDLSAGLSLLERGCVPDATALLRRATTSSPSDSGLSDALARALLEAGDPDAAEAELRRGLAACAESFERRMNLAQLCGDPVQAVVHLEAGIVALDAPGGAGGEDAGSMRARAHCALAEALLAAAEAAPGDATGFDARCERAVTAAIACTEEGKPEGIEARLCLANLRLSQGRPSDAQSAMRDVWGAVAHSLKLLDDATDAETAAEAAERLPEVTIRIAMAKQFVETSLWAFGAKVLESVLLECDFNIEVWFLLAMCYLRNGKVEAARGAVGSLKEARGAPEGCDGTLEERYLEELERAIEEEGKKGEGGGEDDMDQS